jgi:aryl-alcohol dehydrogenase-like predicted oxidoreductase
VREGDADEVPRVGPHGLDGIGNIFWGVGNRRRERGTVEDEVSHATLNAAVDSGITFIDNADVCGMGAERGAARQAAERPEGAHDRGHKGGEES